MARKSAVRGKLRSEAEARPLTERRGRVFFGDIAAGEIEERPDGAGYSATYRSIWPVQMPSRFR